MLDFLLAYPYTINLIIVFILSYMAIIYRHSVVTLLTLLFVYISLHYSFGLLPAFTPGDIDTVESAFVVMHEKSNTISSLIGLTFILFSIVLLLQNLTVLNFKTGFIAITKNKYLYPIFALLLAWIISFLIFWSTTPPPPIFIKYNIIKFLMISIACLLSFAFIYKSSEKPYTLSQLDTTYKIVLYLTIIMTLIAFLQTLTGRAYITKLRVRPEALMFNPNNLAFWYLIVGTFFAYFYSENIRKFSSMIAIVSVTLGFFLANSRTFFLVYIFLSILIIILALLTKQRLMRFLTPILIFWSSFIIFLILSLVLAYILDNERLSAQLLELVSRYTTTIPGIISYLTTLENINTIENSIQAAWQQESITDSIYGRLNPNSIDNSYTALYKYQGLYSLLSILGIFTYMTLIGILTLVKRATIFGIYIFSLFVTLVLTAFFMSVFIVFPPWLFFSTVIALYAAWINNISTD